ncbi:MAG: 2-dehydropantoate 2-reductase [Erysipelotrichaceae bacterium]|nr:2-dehydropantoate 2-reductase [Erysipelotrichaceae bacterium]
MKKIKNVAIIGMGALGVMYGGLIKENLKEGKLYFIGDPARITRLEEDPVYCNGMRCDFEMIDPTMSDIDFDLIIVAVKSTALNSAAKLAKPLVKKDTVVISLLNGISSEEYLEEQLDQGTVITCIAQGMDALKIGNELTYTRLGHLCVGISPSEAHKQEQLTRLRDFFEAMKIPSTLEADINHRVWGKWMLNVGVNQVVMVIKGTFASVQHEGPARDLMIGAMKEVIEVANASGINLGEDDLEGYLDLIATLNPEGMPSMAQDGVARRYSEVEMFSGTVIKKARALGIPVPINEQLYSQVRQIESEY